MTKTTLQLETLTCPTCVKKIEGLLKKTPGVNSYEVLFNTSRVKAEFDENVVSLDDLRGRIQQLGYEVLSAK
ncbi:MAG: heavy-metal-associated domain-containing protein [Clostridiales bacterium]|jgi:copper chaperone CopZ|nr:heavy-metal-associated domain-containing protein [Clostridiales bacterium]